MLCGRKDRSIAFAYNKDTVYAHSDTFLVSIHSMSIENKYNVHSGLPHIASANLTGEHLYQVYNDLLNN
jgi:hypothetical protein